jgi:hypothetical protein
MTEEGPASATQDLAHEAGDARKSDRSSKERASEEAPASATQDLAHDGSEARKSDRSSKERASSVLPLVMSAIAIVISVLALIDQHSANLAAESSSQEAYAVKASFWLIYSPPQPTTFLEGKSNRRQVRAIRRVLDALAAALKKESNGQFILAPAAAVSVPAAEAAVIENQGSAPISNVSLVLEARDETGRLLGSKTIEIGTVPPCSFATVKAIQQVADGLANTASRDSLVVTIDVPSMIFTDNLGVRWIRHQNGTLAKYAGPANNSESYEYPANNIATAHGCS